MKKIISIEIEHLFDDSPADTSYLGEYTDELDDWVINGGTIMKTLTMAEVGGMSLETAGSLRDGKTIWALANTGQAEVNHDFDVTTLLRAILSKVERNEGKI